MSSQTPFKKRRGWIIELALFLVIFFGIRAYMTASAVKGAAPPLEGLWLNSSEISAEKLTQGPFLVYFWASWCKICKLMENSVAAIAQDYPVLSVAYQSGQVTDLERYLQQRGLTQQVAVLVDTEGKAGKSYGIRGVPSSFIIDANQQVRFVEVGYTTEWGLRLRLWWAGWFVIM